MTPVRLEPEWIDCSDDGYGYEFFKFKHGLKGPLVGCPNPHKKLFGCFFSNHWKDGSEILGI